MNMKKSRGGAPAVSFAGLGDLAGGFSKMATKFCNVSVLCAVLALMAIGRPAPAEALLTSTLVDTPTGAVSGHGGGGQYDFASVSMSLDPALTNWVAWSDSFSGSADPYTCLTPTSTSCIGRHGFGTNDYIQLKVTPPVGSALELTMDWNDASGNSSGPQMIVFGAASAAPDVRRYNFSSGSYYYINEAGAFNSLFTSAGTYRFDFSFRDYWGSEGGHEYVYLLADTTPAPVPEAGTLLLLGSGLAGLGAWTRRFRRGRGDTGSTARCPTPTSSDQFRSNSIQP